MTWSVWMLMPDKVSGWSRIAGGLLETDAVRFAEAMLFPARAMPDETSDEEGVR